MTQTRFSTCSFALLAGVAGSLATQATGMGKAGEKDVVVAKEFRVVGADNKIRISLQVTDDNEAAITLYEPDGRRPGIVLRGKKEDWGITLNHHNGSAAVLIGIAHYNMPLMMLCGPPSHRTEFGLVLGEKGIPALVVSDRSGLSGGLFFEQENGNPVMSLRGDGKDGEKVFWQTRPQNPAP